MRRRIIIMHLVARRVGRLTVSLTHWLIRGFFLLDMRVQLLSSSLKQFSYLLWRSTHVKPGICCCCHLMTKLLQTCFFEGLQDGDTSKDLFQLFHCLPLKSVTAKQSQNLLSTHNLTVNPTIHLPSKMLDWLTEVAADVSVAYYRIQRDFVCPSGQRGTFLLNQVWLLIVWLYDDSEFN